MYMCIYSYISTWQMDMQIFSLYILQIEIVKFPGPLFRTWINFNPNIDKQLHPLQCVWRNYLSIPKLQWCNHWSFGMDKQFHPILYRACDYLSMLGLELMNVCNVCEEITYPFSNFNGATIEVWEWINNSIPYFTGHVITYPCWE